jgi:uncharacterized membrane protein YuzA (DUF378 family)
MRFEVREPKHFALSSAFPLSLKGKVMKTLDVVAAILLIVGGLNWGLWGAFEFDLVAAIFGGNTAVLSKMVYILVGAAAAYQAASFKAIQRRWHAAPAMA